MKQSTMYKALGVVAMLAGMAACSNDTEEVIEFPTVEPKEFIVNLGYTGEIEVSESPLSRTVSNNLYGIQVYAAADKELENDMDYYDYRNYAYGLFDDINQMSIKLIEGYKYQFRATMVVDGKTKVWSDYNYDYETGTQTPGNRYSYPFSASSDTECNNSFTFSTTHSMWAITNGDTNLRTSEWNYNWYHRPTTDRYYGETTNYVPQENGRVTINMKRASFGLKLIAEEMNEGDKLEIKMESAPDINLVYPTTETEDIYTFSSVSSVIYNENYSERIPISITWTNADGVTTPLGTHTIEFKRNLKTTVRIKVVENATDSNIGITQEQTEMGDGGEVNVGGGSGVDTPIDPVV